MRLKHFLSIAGLVLLFFMCSVSFTHARSSSSTSKVIKVPTGQTVDNFFVFGHNATIDGKVRNLVLVVGGDLTIHSSATVNELIIVIGGSVFQDQGSHVTENILAFAWNKRVIDAFLFGGAILLSNWIIKLFIAIVIIFFSTLTSFVIPKSVEKQGLFGSWKLWLTGLITGLWLLIIIAILAVTIVGIPVALCLLIFPALGFFMVSGAISRDIGLRLLPERQGRWMPTVLGAVILSALLSFPLVGILLYLAFMVISLGHIMYWIADKWEGRKRTNPQDI